MTRQHNSNETTPLITDTTSAALLENGANVEPGDGYQTGVGFRVAATMFSFVVLGLFTSSIGAMLLPISHYYTLSDLRVSLIFLLSPVGYVLAAQCNALIHRRMGQLGIALLGPLFHVFAAAIISLHPPFFAIVPAFACSAIGTGLLDGSWCAWAGSMHKASTVSGLLHGSFSIGAATGPLLGAWLMSARHWEWFEFYYLLTAVSLVELVILASAFWHEDGAKYKEQKKANPGDHQRTYTSIFRYRAMWFAAVYFLAYVGTETAISGWIVSFMMRAQHASSYEANLSLTGFWSGMAAGRFILGATAEKIGVERQHWHT